jgi:hypothetical protein
MLKLFSFVQKKVLKFEVDLNDFIFQHLRLHILPTDPGQK